MVGPPPSGHAHGHAIPVFARSDFPSHPLGELTAEIFWVTATGKVADEVQQVPVQNGVAVYTGPPLPAGLFFAIRIREAGAPGSIFRSGPLHRLPGPPSPVLATGAISLVLGGGAFDLTTPGTEGAPELLVERLQELPAPLQFVGVDLTADRDGNYVVSLRGRLRLPISLLGWDLSVRPAFVYRRAWRLVASTSPGRPEPSIHAQPVGTASISPPFVLPYAAVLDQLVKEGVERQLSGAMRVIASFVLAFADAHFGLQTVSVSTLKLTPRIDGANASVVLGAGAITGVPAPPTPGVLDQG
jgi:hypothetical protein